MAALSLVDSKHLPIKSEIKLVREYRMGASVDMAFLVKVPDLPFKIWVTAKNSEDVTTVNQIDTVLTNPQ